MLDSIKIGHFISEKRKELKMTQQQLADKLKVSFQAVSKWENGSAYPNLEVLYELAVALGVKVDDILTGCEKNGEGLSYSKAGIDITYTDTIKQEMAKHRKQRTGAYLMASVPSPLCTTCIFLKSKNRCSC